MGRYFLQDTTLAALEREMQQIPGFETGIVRHSRKEYCFRRSGQALPQQEMLGLLLKEIPNPVLSARIRKSYRESGGMEPMFRSTEHKRRFQGLCQDSHFPALAADNRFAAAVFLLCADTFLWNRAKPHVTAAKIEYSGISIRGIDTDGYALFYAAKEMTDGAPHFTRSELGDPELINERLFKVIVTGILISRHGMKAVMRGKGEEKENDDIASA